MQSYSRHPPPSERIFPRFAGVSSAGGPRQTV